MLYDGAGAILGGEQGLPVAMNSISTGLIHAICMFYSLIYFQYDMIFMCVINLYIN